PRVGRQVAVGAQLQPPVAGLGQLVQEPVPGGLAGVVGEPDAPGGGAAAQPQPGAGAGHRRTSLPAAVLGDVLPDLVEVVAAGVLGPLLPGRHAHGGEAVAAPGC